MNRERLEFIEVSKIHCNMFEVVTNLSPTADPFVPSSTQSSLSSVSLLNCSLEKYMIQLTRDMIEKLEPIGDNKVVERSEEYLALKLLRKEKRKERRKEYYKKNVDTIKDNRRKYYAMNDKRKISYEENKNMINEKRREKRNIKIRKLDQGVDGDLTKLNKIDSSVVQNIFISGTPNAVKDDSDSGSDS